MVLNLANIREQLTRIGLLALILSLGACVNPVDYGSIRHSDYVDNERCNPPRSSSQINSDKSYYFVTSRLPDCLGSDLKLLNHRGDKVRYGRFATPGTISDKKGKSKPSVNFAFDNHIDWWEQLSEAMQARDGRVLVYVHGFRETFYTSSKDTAQIARLTGFKGPVIQYSWPSQGEFLKYVVDETNMYWDERNFRNFLMALAQEEWTKEIILVSHSLGARLVIPAVEYVDEKSSNKDSSIISNIILASPDIDRQNFERDIAQEILAMRRVTNNRRITVYTSAKDRALALSADIHGYPRLGVPRCFDPFLARELREKGLPERCYAKHNDGLTIVDTTAVTSGRSGHSDYLKSSAVCQDFSDMVASSGLSASNRHPTHLPHVFTLAAPKKGEEPDNMNICKRTAE